MQISVVIPSKDSPSLLDCLLSLATSAARVPSVSIEVIVVDSSKHPITIDATLSELVNLSIIDKDLPRLEARIVGIKASHGEGILNLDTDQVVHPDLLSALAASTSESIAIPEHPTDTGRWTELVSRSMERTSSLFRRHPSEDIPVIPRFYRRLPLLNAIESLIQDAARGTGGRLPTQHEDTILFSYFLRANDFNARDCVGFVEMPIYHAVPPLNKAGQKSYHYGWDLGSESRRMRSGELTIDRSIWGTVLRLDYGRFQRYWDSDYGMDISGFIYDLFRSPFYGVGFLTGYVQRHLRMKKNTHPRCNS